MDQQPPITQAELVPSEPCPPTPLTQPKPTSTKRYSGLRFHCPTCRKTSGCHSSHRTHVKKQACSASPACDAEHAHHKIQLDFGSPVEALAWFHAQELDRFFAIESSRPKFQVYRCNQRASHQARPRQRTQKLQACSAKITFREALMCKCHPVAYQICPDEQMRTLVYGCLTHSHALEPQRTRWSKVTKERTLAWVREGLPVEAIIAESAALAEQDPMQKPLSRSDIYRMAKTANLSDVQVSSPELDLTYVEDFKQIREKFQQIDDFMKSNNFSHARKRTLVNSLLIQPINDVTMPALKIKPISHVLKSDRKRAHQSENRSLSRQKKTQLLAKDNCSSS